MSIKNITRRTFTALACGVAASAAIAADPYPSRPIRIVVCTAPGGATDITTRLVAQKMSEKLGQPVIVDNRPGADTLVGILHVRDQPADGYTILAQSLNFSTLPYIKKNPGYSPADFTGVGMMSRIPFIFLVGGDEPVRSVADYVAYARKEKGKLSYGHGGVAGAPHIAGELFKRAYGLDDVLAVPYKGNGAVMPDLMAGRVSYFFDAYVSSGGHVASGKMKALAVTAPQRLPTLPNVPTFRELGVDFTYSVWLGLLAKNGTPPEVINKLSEAVRYALNSKEVGDRLRADGSDTSFMPSKEFTEYLAREYADMAKTAADLKFTKE
ncbi:tripartite tricarboxylate transporter substrate binding protein [Ramlibacter sp. 2FC]|uniref:Bug family tripartite tricarboxylate transporter substrate binding protein n=1 Tax=Ramlibacter sp. 2FC TaxID=2502188 RepID=UPI0010F94A62|nr:tripartite tricarboxylate transporter substrate binding protein [Ramlibacter sp. 2FC]